MSAQLKEVIDHWEHIAPVVNKPTNDEEYQRAVAALDFMLEIAGESETHPLNGLIQLLADGIEAYDAENHPDEPVDPRDMMAFLMEQHGLRQSDLPEVGSQGVVSEILRGKRQLNLRQIKALAKRFQVTLATFLPDTPPQATPNLPRATITPIK